MEALENLQREQIDLDDQITSAVRKGTGDLSRLLDRRDAIKRQAVISEARALREQIDRAEKRRSQAKEELRKLDETISLYAEDARQAQDIANLKIRRVNLAEIQAFGLEGEVEDLFEQLSRLRARLGDIVGQLVGK